MRANPSGFLEKQGDIREKRRKFELNLKKQTQFMKGQNERKVNYNKGIREIYWIGHLVKTNPIQSQTKPIYVSPQHCWGLKNLFEKTKPMLIWANCR